jgi:hypothetical protein
MFRHVLKLSLLAIGLAVAPLAAQQPTPQASRPSRDWVAQRSGRHAAGGRRRHQGRKHRQHRAQRNRARGTARMHAYRGWRTI